MKSFGSFSGAELDGLLEGRAPAAGTDLEKVARLIDRVQEAYLTDVDPALEATHLEGVLKTVHLIDKGDLAVRPASKVNGPGAYQVSGLPTRRRKLVLETLFGSLAAKIAAGGIAIAMASTGAAAATGNLPDQMQTGISEAVERIGISIPAGADADLDVEVLDEEVDADLETDLDVEVDGEGEGVDDGAEGFDESGDDTENGDEGHGEPNANAAFGQSVADDARDGGVDGQEISQRARQMAEERKAAGQAHRPDFAGGDADGDESGDGSEDDSDGAEVTAGPPEHIGQSGHPSSAGGRGIGNARR